MNNRRQKRKARTNDEIKEERRKERERREEKKAEDQQLIDAMLHGKGLVPISDEIIEMVITRDIERSKDNPNYRVMPKDDLIYMRDEGWMYHVDRDSFMEKPEIVLF